MVASGGDEGEVSPPVPASLLSRVETPLWLALLYNLLPIDLVADIVPVVGLVDDLGVTGVALVMAGRSWAKDRSRGPTLLPLVIAAVYAALPVDLVPDVVPLLGRVDDVVVALLAVTLSWWRSREEGP